MIIGILLFFKIIIKLYDVIFFLVSSNVMMFISLCICLFNIYLFNLNYDLGNLSDIK